jgi:hypothetical protein
MLYPTELQAHIIAALIAGHTCVLSRNGGKLQAHITVVWDLIIGIIQHYPFTF